MKSLSVAILFFFFSTSFSQQIQLSGNIIDEDKLPLPEVEIKNLNTNYLNYSNFDGNFKFKCNKGDTISFNYIGKEVSTIIANDSSFFKIVLISDYSIHSDGYKTENIHNFQVLTNPDKDDFIFDYRFSFSHYSKREIGRKRIHALTNHLDFGLSYFNFNRDYISVYFQINSFFNLKKDRLGNLNYLLLSPYINIGTTTQIKKFKPNLRFDLGVNILKLDYSNYFSISIDSQLMVKSYGEKLFFGITISKPIFIGTGWYE